MDFNVGIEYDGTRINSGIEVDSYQEKQEYYFTLYFNSKPLVKSGWVKENNFSFEFFSDGEYQIQGHVKFDDKNLWKRSEIIEITSKKEENNSQNTDFNPTKKSLEEFLDEHEIYGKQVQIKRESILCEIDAFVSLRENSDGTLVMFPAAQRAGNVQNPIFHRWSWFSQFPNYNFIAVSDPSLHLFDIPGGWFMSGAETDMIVEMAKFLDLILEKVGCSRSDTIFYGSSMGGFGAMMVASEMPGVSVLAEVPQTDLRDYSVRGAVKMLEDEIYGGIKLTDLDSGFHKMISVVDRFKHNLTIPETVIVTNPTDEGFLQCVDFVKKTVSISGDMSYRGKITLEILPEDLGHKPMEPSDSIPKIMKILSKEN